MSYGHAHALDQAAKSIRAEMSRLFNVMVGPQPDARVDRHLVITAIRWAEWHHRIPAGERMETQERERTP